MKLELTELVWEGDTYKIKETGEEVFPHHIEGPLPILYSASIDKKIALMNELQDEIKRRGLQDEVNAYIQGNNILLPNLMVTAVDLYKID